MEFLRSTWGTGTVEWLVVAAIVVTVVGSVLLALAHGVGDKLEQIANNL